MFSAKFVFAAIIFRCGVLQSLTAAFSWSETSVRAEQSFATATLVMKIAAETNRIQSAAPQDDSNTLTLRKNSVYRICSATSLRWRACGRQLYISQRSNLRTKHQFAALAPKSI